MGKGLQWKTYAYGLVLLIVGLGVSVILFLYAFINKGPWYPFFWASGLSLAFLITMKLLALNLDDKRNLDLAAMQSEALSGAFGWMWMGVAGISVVVFFRALFFAGAWSDFFVCMLVSGVLKWFMNWANNMKAGTVFKRRLVEQGMTKEGAREVRLGQLREVTKFQFGFRRPEAIISKADADTIFRLNRADWESYAKQFAFPTGWKGELVSLETGTNAIGFDPASGFGLSIQPFYHTETSPPVQLLVGSYYAKGFPGGFSEHKKLELEKAAQADLGRGYSVTAKFTPSPKGDFIELRLSRV
jgi:hypothetical protein